MKRGPDAAILLARALTSSAAAHGLDAVVVVQSSTPWASVTFAGSQHVLTVRASDGDRLAAWLARLPDLDLDLRGHTADVTVDTVEESPPHIVATLLALTIED